MANQDILFPLMDRNTRVDIGDRNLRVKRIEKRARSHRVDDDEVFDPTQDARVRDYLKQTRKRREGQQPPADGENHASHQLPGTPAVADDPRRQQHDQDDDEHKGVHLDTYV